MSDKNALFRNTCTICLEPYKDPKILQCFHTFCAKCLQDIIISNGKSGNFYCPLCRKVIQISENGVDGFQTNFYVTDIPSKAMTLCVGNATNHDHINPVPGETYNVLLSGCESGSLIKRCVVTVHYTTPGKCPPPFLIGKPSGNSIQLSWEVPQDDGGSPITNYITKIMISDKATYKVYNGDIPSCKVDGLYWGRLNLFAVRAQNAAGCGPWSDFLEVIIDPYPPGEPKDFTIEEILSTSVVLGWKEPECNGAEITRYIVAVYRGSKLKHSIHTYSSSCQKKINNLVPRTRYSFSVQAVNKLGNGKCCESKTCVTLADKPSPVKVIASNSTSTTISLRWKEPRNNGSQITGYIICMDNSGKVNLQNKGKYTMKNLKAGTLYKFSVQAVNSMGPSDIGTTVAVNTLAKPKSFMGIDRCEVSQAIEQSKFSNIKNADSGVLSALNTLNSNSLNILSYESLGTDSFKELERYEIDRLHNVMEKPSLDALSVLKSSLFGRSFSLWQEITRPEKIIRRQIDEIMEEVLTESLGFTPVELNICNIVFYVFLLILGFTTFEINILELLLYVLCSVYIGVLILHAVLLDAHQDLINFAILALVIWISFELMIKILKFARKCYPIKCYHQKRNLKRNFISIPWTMVSEMKDCQLYTVTFHSDYYVCKALSIKLGDKSDKNSVQDIPSTRRNAFKKKLISRLQNLNKDHVCLWKNASDFPQYLQFYLWLQYFCHNTDYEKVS